ncbi:hypothetical protein O181_056600 [Austropuccinia psidii MF-1]|uniref:Uncharacterized protein n=1 Tax=Austropuccinia psidii MF-1 TaxID=1389203 RepID=A0A9Q3E6E3_9BASI|nr:hypothetical protein [Austropuccinia psidii MF-1]
MEGEESFKRGGPRSRWQEEEDEEGESDETEVEAAVADPSEGPEALNLLLYNQTLFSQANPILLNMLEEITTFRGQLTHEVALKGNFKALTSRTPSMKAPDIFDGTQAHKL